MAHAVNPPHTTASRKDGSMGTFTVRKKRSVHKNATKKAKIKSEINAERFISLFLTDFFAVILEKDKKI